MTFTRKKIKNKCKSYYYISYICKVYYKQTFMKTKTLLFILLTVMFAPMAAAQDYVTVCDGGEVNAHVPVFGSYANVNGAVTEFIIPSTTDSISSMIDKEISAMRFYTSSPAEAAWDATFKVYLKEVDDTTISSISGPDECYVVYTGDLDASGSYMDVTFDDNFSYQGSNLLVGIYVAVGGEWKDASFYGIGATGAAYFESGFGFVENFLPKTTFTYEDHPACPKPTGLTATLATGDCTVATFSWTPGGDETDWFFEYATSADFSDAVSVNVSDTPSVTISDLTPETTYYTRVMARCLDISHESNWSTVCTFVATNKTIIGSGDATNYYLPSLTIYKKALTQQIYTKNELGAAGHIESLDFYCTTNATTRDMDIYIVHTDKNNFNNNSDWIPATSGDLVFSGSVAFTEGDWTTIILDNSFDYDGNRNIAIIIDDNSESYEDDYAVFRAFNASGQAIYVYADNTNFDPINPNYEGYLGEYKNQIRLVKVVSSFDVEEVDDNVSDIFVYQDGNELIVNGEGELQIYDIMGRFVASYHVDGDKRIGTERFANTVYIFRLVGSNSKTQKIVVR